MKLSHWIVALTFVSFMSALLITAPVDALHTRASRHAGTLPAAMAQGSGLDLFISDTASLHVLAAGHGPVVNAAETHSHLPPPMPFWTNPFIAMDAHGKKNDTVSIAGMLKHEIAPDFEPPNLFGLDYEYKLDAGAVPAGPGSSPWRVRGAVHPFLGHLDLLFSKFFWNTGPRAGMGDDVLNYSWLALGYHLVTILPPPLDPPPIRGGGWHCAPPHGAGGGGGGAGGGGCPGGCGGNGCQAGAPNVSVTGTVFVGPTGGVVIVGETESEIPIEIVELTLVSGTPLQPGVVLEDLLPQTQPFGHNKFVTGKESTNPQTATQVLQGIVLSAHLRYRTLNSFFDVFTAIEPFRCGMPATPGQFRVRFSNKGLVEPGLSEISVTVTNLTQITFENVALTVGFPSISQARYSSLCEPIGMPVFDFAPLGPKKSATLTLTVDNQSSNVIDFYSLTRLRLSGNIQ
jgi:hypothetical protein